MARIRTRGSLFRRILFLRAVLAALMFILFAATWFSSSVVAMVVFGLFFLLFLAGLFLRIYLYTKLEPAQRAEPIDPKLVPSLRYLMSKKYPYKPEDTSS